MHLKRKTPPLYATRGEAPAPSSPQFVVPGAVKITLPDDPCSAPKGTPNGSLLRSTARQRKEAVTVPNLPRPTAGDSNRRPGLAMTHGVRARHDQLTNTTLAAWFGASAERPPQNHHR